MRRSGLGRVHQDARGDKTGNGREHQREEDHGRQHDSKSHLRIFGLAQGRQ